MDVGLQDGALLPITSLHPSIHSILECDAGGAHVTLHHQGHISQEGLCKCGHTRNPAGGLESGTGTSRYQQPTQKMREELFCITQEDTGGRVVENLSTFMHRKAQKPVVSFYQLPPIGNRDKYPLETGTSTKVPRGTGLQ